MVVLVHTHQCFRLSGLQNLIPRFCQMGCQIFFVLSSYGLCHSFSAKRPTWFSHMKKRISKLAVGYWGAILLYAVYRVGMAFLENESLLQALNIPGIILNALFLMSCIAGRIYGKCICRIKMNYAISGVRCTPLMLCLQENTAENRRFLLLPHIYETVFILRCR